MLVCLSQNQGLMGSRNQPDLNFFHITILGSQSGTCSTQYFWNNWSISNGENFLNITINWKSNVSRCFGFTYPGSLLKILQQGWLCCLPSVPQTDLVLCLDQFFLSSSVLSDVCESKEWAYMCKFFPVHLCVLLFHYSGYKTYFFSPPLCPEGFLFQTIDFTACISLPLPSSRREKLFLFQEIL